MHTQNTDEKKPTAVGGLLDKLVFSGAVWAAARWLAAPYQWLWRRRMKAIFEAGER